MESNLEEQKCHIEDPPIHKINSQQNINLETQTNKYRRTLRTRQKTKIVSIPQQTIKKQSNKKTNNQDTKESKNGHNILQTIMEKQYLNKDNPQQPQTDPDMPKLAIHCAKFFHSLSKFCLSYYQNYNRQQAMKKTIKTKFIQKQEKAPRPKRKFKKFKKIKNPDQPKKPLTAYIMYFQFRKPSFAQKFPSLNLTELTKLIAKQWNQLRQDEKEPYLSKASGCRRQYEEQMNQFRQTDAQQLIQPEKIVQLAQKILKEEIPQNIKNEEQSSINKDKQNLEVGRVK